MLLIYIMKSIVIIVSLLIILYINCDDYCSLDIKAKSFDDCKNLKLPDNYKYCCYVKLEDKDGETNGCFPLTKDQYDKIDDYIDGLAKKSKDDGDNGDIKKLDCKSYYLEFCLLSMLFILL